MKVSVLNDTALGSVTGGAHFGCTLVMETLYDLLEENGHEVVQKVGANEPRFEIDKSADLVIVNGEGSIHHNHRRELVKVARSWPSILINAVYQENDALGMDEFNYVAVRENQSAKECPVECDIVPDLLFASRTLAAFDTYPRKTTEDIGVTDNVLNQIAGGDGGISALQSPEAYITQLLKHKRMCCGRFHAVAACAVLGIPFSAWPSNTHKIVGMMEDMGIEHYHFRTKEEALAHVPTDFNSNIVLYVEDAKLKIHKLFERLEDFV